jgi:hypothetical protein
MSCLTFLINTYKILNHTWIYSNNYFLNWLLQCIIQLTSTSELRNRITTINKGLNTNRKRTMLPSISSKSLSLPTCLSHLPTPSSKHITNSHHRLWSQSITNSITHKTIHMQIKFVWIKNSIKLFKISGILTHDIERRGRLIERRRRIEVRIRTMSLRRRRKRRFRNQFRTPMYRFLQATGRRYCALRFRSRSWSWSRSRSIDCGGVSVHDMRLDFRFRLRLFHGVEFNGRRSGRWRRVKARFEGKFRD